MTTARFELKANGDKTILKLTHSNVPDDREEDLADGWKEFYLGPLKELLES